MLLKQSTERNRMILLIDSTDHISGKTSATLTITASKNGAAFASITPTVTERGNGWYSLALTSSHTDTLGDFALHITASGADPTDIVDQIVAALPGEVASANLTQVLGTAITESGAGRLAASLTHFLDVATPALTVESAIQGGDCFTLLGTPALGTVSDDIAALPSAQDNADTLLKRDWTAVTGEAARSVLNALRFLRNRWTVTAGILTVYEEDGTTLAWQANVSSDAAADPIVGNQPT